jgi:hypothetical protein
MNVDALIHELKSIYIWIPYSSPVAKNKIASLIHQLGGSPPTESELSQQIKNSN